MEQDNKVQQSTNDKVIVIVDASNKNDTQPIYDVIISGGGPVGLFLACELALAKCSVLVLEKEDNPHSPLKKLPFGLRGLSSLGIENFDRRGLLKELQQKMQGPGKPQGPGKQRTQGGGHFAFIQVNPNNIDYSQWKYRLPSSTDAAMFSEMEANEAVLTNRAESLGVHIKRGFGVSGYTQTENEVTVQSNGHTFQSKYLVGCDGSHSVVRKIGEFEFAGTEPEFTGYSVLIDLADPEKIKPGRNMTDGGMYWQFQPGYIMMLEFDGGACQKKYPITFEHIQEVLRRVSNTDVTISALHNATTWTDRARQATSYRKGRVFLAGDAAHIHAPLGGQGLNLGLGDAMNLGWKLAAAIHGKAPSGLLDSYYTERYPIGAQVLDWSRAQVSIMKPNPHSRAMNAVIRDFINTRDGATYFAGRVCGVYTQYNLGGDNPIVGHSVPNFEFEDGVTIGDLMHDGKGILLDFNSSDSLKTLAGEYEQLKYVSGKAKEQLGLSAVLIRPDGFIAWASASDSELDQQSLRQSAALWFLLNKLSI